MSCGDDTRLRNPAMKHIIVPVTPFQQNCTILWCEQTKRAAVVDPGGDVDLILSALERTGAEVERILLTHGHLDHAGAAGELAHRFGVPIEGPHRADSYWLEGLAQQAAMFGFPALRPVVPDRWLEEGETVRVGAAEFAVLHCPGHTPGHVVFHHAPDRLALVGDVLFQGSIGRTDFPGGDYDTLIRSIRDKLLPMSDDTVFIPGHGPISTIGAERRTNPFITR
jgi:glyoxylase-like metal-dependent hydrolase (beta-lactamase superfamily II)